MGSRSMKFSPYLLLFKPPDALEEESCASLLADRLDRFGQGDVESMFREHVASSVRQVKARSRVSATDSAIATKAKTLCRAGETGRALKAIDGAERVHITTQVAQELAALFTLRSDATNMDVEHNGVVPAVDRGAYVAILLRTIKRLPRLSAPGPLQLRNEHLVVLAGSSMHAENVALALATLGDGSAPAAVISFLRGGLLAPLEKDDGSYRPLTLSNVLRRTGLKALLHMFKDDVAAGIGDLQYGIARKSGTDSLQKSLQTRLATFPTSAVCSIDFKAGFQTVDRAKACQAVSKHAPNLAASCQAWYMGEAEHSIFDMHGTRQSVPTDMGVDQGCPLGAFMFAMAMRDPAERVLQYARSLDPNAGFHMYLDDCYILADPSCIHAVMDYAVEASLALK